jgi:hypothetical protein
VVDGTALEMRRACKGSVGSNPTLSAIHFPHTFTGIPRRPPDSISGAVFASNIPCTSLDVRTNPEQQCGKFVGRSCYGTRSHEAHGAESRTQPEAARRLCALLISTNNKFTGFASGLAADG